MRYHVVSLAALLLALALGILLGSTSISDHLLSAVGRERDSLGKQVEDLRAERNSLKVELGAADRFGNALGPLAVRDQLQQRNVVLITTDDVNPAERDAMKALLSSAGANVTGDVELTQYFVDPGRGDQIRHAVTGLLPADVQIPNAADPGTLAGGLLGPLMLLDPRDGQPQVSPEERAAAFGRLTVGGFAHVRQEVQPAQLALVLTGGKATGRSSADRAAILARLATQIDRAGAGAVLAGGAGSAAGNGAVGAARADESMSSVVSTVDNVDSGFGRVATVLALREQWERRVGHYGTAGSAQGPAPNSRS